jgi:hypothetical protein
VKNTTSCNCAARLPALPYRNPNAGMSDEAMASRFRVFSEGIHNAPPPREQKNI